MQKILVIDDSKMIRMRVKDMLPSDKVEIIEARDGKEGLDLIYSERPKLIILDFLLPKKSGWEVYQEIKNHSELKHIPLVLMSGRKEEVTEKISERLTQSRYVHIQGVASEIWSINHNLNRPPSVTVVDSAGQVVLGNVIYIDNNNISVQFSAGFSGKAYLN